MRVSLLCTVLLTVAGLFSSIDSAAAKDSVAKGALLHCDSMNYNFGVVNRREGDIRHTFIIENRGDEPLIITNIVASCSCMKHSISRKPIAVGEQRELTITYELKKMPPGTFSKSVIIYSTSCDNIPTRFTLSGRSSYTTRKEYKDSLE